MASVTVRNLDESVKKKLRLRAVRHGWSMEQEIRQILQQTVAPEQMAGESLAQRVHERFAGFNLAALPIPGRKPARRPPEFGKA